MRKPRRLRTVIPVVLAALALPAQAAAHGRAPTVALDYRLALAPATQTLPGVHVRVLDGDRDFQVRVDPGTELVVRGALQEPLLRIDSTGVWVNASSPTATERQARLADQARLDPPERRRGRSSGTTTGSRRRRRARPGPAGQFVVPVDVNGVPHAISGDVRPGRAARLPGPGPRPPRSSWPGSCSRSGGGRFARR